MDRLPNEHWKTYAKRKDYYKESEFNGVWVVMNKREILEYEEMLQQRKEREEAREQYKIKVLYIRKGLLNIPDNVINKIIMYSFPKNSDITEPFIKCVKND